MQKRGIFKSKNAIAGAGILAILGAVLGVAAIIFFTWLLFSFSQLAGNQEEQTTIVGFNSLAFEIQTLLDNPNQFASTSLDNPFHYYIDEDFILVGYNNDNIPLKDECEEEEATKPLNEECTNSACLCLHKETGADNDFDDDCDSVRCNQPIMCYKLDGVDNIFTLDYYNDGEKYNSPESIYGNIMGKEFNPASTKYPDNYAYFFIYGECEDWWSDDLFETHPFYIEKFIDQGKTNILIAAIYPEDDTISKREQKMREEYLFNLDECLAKSNLETRYDKFKNKLEYSAECKVLTTYYYENGKYGTGKRATMFPDQWEEWKKITTETIS